jgi:hypothetical protein
MFQRLGIKESEYRQMLIDAQKYLDEKSEIEAEPYCDNNPTRGFGF